MGGRDNAYSRLVFWLKILLPLGALVILSTMFLIARTIDPSRAIPYAKVDVTTLARESRITAPSYAGVTSDGAAVSVIAAEARPDPTAPGRATASNLAARIEMPSGLTATMHSAAGEIDSQANRVHFTGDVSLETSNDYHISAAEMTAALDHTAVEATGGVTATAPRAQIRADTVTLGPDPAVQGQYVLVFNGAVKLVYQPGQ